MDGSQSLVGGRDEMGMGNGEGYASRPARWLEEKEDDGRPEQHGVGAAVGSVGAAAGSAKSGSGKNKYADKPSTIVSQEE